MRYHSTPSERLVIRKTINDKIGKDMEKRETSCTVGNVNCAAAMENSMEIISKY